MYKLLTTAAVIMTVATPTLANDWTGGADLAKNLDTIYSSLDGQEQFKDLQGAVTATNGQLTEFYDTVSKGVTHITLSTDANNNITANVVAGTSFDDINVKKDNLVNRVNYDLFVNESNVNDDSYVAGTNYSVVKYNLTETTPANPADNVYATDHSAGLAGRKIDGLVTDVNTVNTFLTGTGTTKTQSETFVTEWGAGSGTTAGVDVAKIQSDILGLNTAINTAKDSGAIDGEGYFGNIGLGGINETNINNFVIPNFVSHDQIGNGTATAGGYTTISNWANSVQSITVDGQLYQFAGTEPLSLDAEGKVVSVDGTVTDPATDAKFTAIN